MIPNRHNTRRTPPLVETNFNTGYVDWLYDMTGGCGWNFRCMNDYFYLQNKLN